MLLLLCCSIVWYLHNNPSVLADYLSLARETTMRASALLLLVLFFKATWAFQVKQVSLTQSTKSVRILDGRYVLLGVAGNDILNDVVPTTQRQRAAINDHDVVVSTRQTFLAKALIASTLTTFAVVSNAHADEFACKYDCSTGIVACLFVSFFTMDTY